MTFTPNVKPQRMKALAWTSSGQPFRFRPHSMICTPSKVEAKVPSGIHVALSLVVTRCLLRPLSSAAVAAAKANADRLVTNYEGFGSPKSGST
jgi:hypothetical protein